MGGKPRKVRQRALCRYKDGCGHRPPPARPPAWRRCGGAELL